MKIRRTRNERLIIIMLIEITHWTCRRLVILTLYRSGALLRLALYSVTWDELVLHSYHSFQAPLLSENNRIN